MKKRALISVSDKRDIVEFARELVEMGYEVISTGGTAELLAGADVEVTGISEITGFPECLGGRVKTLHPAVHGGILAIRDNQSHMQQLNELNIDPIDMVVINLYPFKETILKPGVSMEDAVENIDIGGPAMLRSAAKNHRDVTVICDPDDYGHIVEEIKDRGVSVGTRYRLALKAFEHTAAYDALIADYLRKRIGAAFPDKLTLTFEKAQSLRYGENPHQKAYYYKEAIINSGTLAEAKQLHGKELSFNNINDTNGALEALKEFSEPAVVAVKHANTCGAAEGKTIREAYLKTFEGDPISIYGGIIALNRTVDKETAEEINRIFVEIVIAPDYSPKALEILTAKANIRILKLSNICLIDEGTMDMKKVSGGLLFQESDQAFASSDMWKFVTVKAPTEDEIIDLAFGMRVVKHIKSNGIVIAKNRMTLGVGSGQTNRIWAVQNAIRQAVGDLHGAVLASDAFFPFDDCVKAAAEAGISAIIQPGGSVSDRASVKKADELGVSMVFSGMRHFKH